MATDPIERAIRQAERPIDPRPEFAEALLTRLLAHLEPKPGDPTTDAKESTVTTQIAMPAGTGIPAPRPAWWRDTRHTGHKRRSWALTHLATAALLLLTLVSGLIAFGTPRDWTPRNWGLFTQSSPDVENELIGRAEVAAFPDYVTNFTGIVRLTLAPGQSLASGPDSIYGDGLYLFVVEAGSVSLTADGPAELTTGGNDTAAPMENGVESILVAGDRGVLWPGTAATWRNAGPQPAVVLHAAIGEAVGWFDIEEDQLTRSLSFPWPTLPATFALHRLVFEPGASLPVADLPGLMMLGVDSGSLDVPLQAGPDAPIQIRSFGVDDPFLADAWKLAPGESFRNSGTEPVVVYVLLGESTGPPATPTA